MDTFDNKDILIINCPMGISPEPLILIGAVAPIIGAMDGSNSISDILDKFSPYGITKELVEELVGLLSKGLFLSGPEYFVAEKKTREDFALSTVRQAALAGRGYASSREVLLSEIREYLDAKVRKQDLNPSKLKCLIAPHIDYHRGSKCYGETFTHLSGAKHDLYVLIGTSHQYSKHMFHLSAKDFENPISPLRCKREFINSLAKSYGVERSFADEFLHRKEHSLELQLPFLSFLNPEAQIAPILVGGFHHLLKTDRAPTDHEPYESFAQALADEIKKEVTIGTNVCFIAGVDMAHVGKHFGDDSALSAKFMEQVEERDRIYLKCIEERNKMALWNHIAEDGDARKICGWPTLYLVLDVMDRVGIKTSNCIYDYRQAVDYKTDCAVTFAGVGLYEV